MKVKTNVWTCADEQDTAGLRAALRLVPSAANVPGWSYSGGKRRGVFYNSDRRCYEISDDPRARAATILHLAAVRGNVDIAVLVFSYGARVEVVLGNPGSAALCAPRELDALPVVNARDIAVANSQAGLIGKDVLELFEAAAVRQNSVLERLCEAETFQRRLLEMKEADALKVLEAFSQDGLVDVTVEVRGLLKRERPLSSSGNVNHSSAGRQSRMSDQVLSDGNAMHELSGTEKGAGGGDGEHDASVARADSRAGPAESLSRKQVHHVFIRRCASKQELQSAVERIVGQSCVISFLVPVVHGASSVDTSTESIVSPSRRRARALVEKPVELHSRNIHLLLSGQRDIVCVARPLLRLVEEPVAGDESPVRKQKKTRAGQGDVTVEEIRHALDESRTASSAARHRERGTPELTANSTTNRSASRATDDDEGGTPVGQRHRLRTPMDHVRDLVQRYDERHLADSANTTRIKQRISEDDEQRLLGQLYDASVKKEATRRAETQRYIEEGVSLLFRRPKKATLTPELEESIARLGSESVAKRAEKIAQLEAALLATVPKPPESTLAEEDRDAAKERLISATHREEVLAELRQKYHGDVTKGKKLSKERIAACVENVYTKAMESKAANLAKIATEYGDFRARLGPGKKISKEEEVALATRLSKRD